MPALGFKIEFVEGVENGVAAVEGAVLPYPSAGVKRQTIRALRKREFRVGDDLMLYYGMRTKQCRKLGQVVCGMVRDIRISKDSVEVASMEGGEWLQMDVAEVEDLAVADGFSSGLELIDPSTWQTQKDGKRCNAGA